MRQSSKFFLMNIFKKIIDEKSNQTMNNLKYNKSWAHFKNYQKIVWDEDSKENIIKHVELMINQNNLLN